MPADPGSFNTLINNIAVAIYEEVQTYGTPDQKFLFGGDKALTTAAQGLLTGPIPTYCMMSEG
jgi:hypothetical protein